MTIFTVLHLCSFWVSLHNLNSCFIIQLITKNKNIKQSLLIWKYYQGFIVMILGATCWVDYKNFFHVGTLVLFEPVFVVENL
jgi:hypothetical protein